MNNICFPNFYLKHLKKVIGNPGELGFLRKKKFKNKKKDFSRVKKYADYESELRFLKSRIPDPNSEFDPGHCRTLYKMVSLSYAGRTHRDTSNDTKFDEIRRDWTEIQTPEY